MNDQEFADLAERTHQLKTLTGQTGWPMYLDRAHAEIAKHQRLILGGNLTEPEYRRETGWVQGALLILELPDQAQEELEQVALERQTLSEDTS